MRGLTEQFAKLRARAKTDPIGVDISDYSDEYCEGFLAGQVSVLEEVERDDLLGLSRIVGFMCQCGHWSVTHLRLANGLLYACPVCGCTDMKEG